MRSGSSETQSAWLWALSEPGVEGIGVSVPPPTSGEAAGIGLPTVAAGNYIQVMALSEYFFAVHNRSLINACSNKYWL